MVVDLVEGHRQAYDRRGRVSERAEIEQILSDHGLTWSDISQRPLLSLQAKIRELTRAKISVLIIAKRRCDYDFLYFCWQRNLLSTVPFNGEYAIAV